MKKRLVILLASSLFLMFALEIAASVMHRLVLRTMRESEQQIQAAASIGRVRNGSVHILFAGNSLLRFGVDAQALQSALSPPFVAHTTAIVDSGFADWYYGLGSLLAEGSRPKLIVLGISPAQLVSDRPPTQTTIHALWAVPELMRYALDTHASLTSLSNMLLERYSDFFYLRNELRTTARGFLPQYREMASHWLGRTGQYSDSFEPSYRAIAERRLAQLKSLGQKYDADFVYLIVPTNQVDDEELVKVVAMAAESTGVQVIAPIGEREWDSTHFADGYHLNSGAAREFSYKVASQLNAQLSSRYSPSVTSSVAPSTVR